MSPIAAALVNWNDLWKIILTALVGGTGVVIVFAHLLRPAEVCASIHKPRHDVVSVSR